MSREKKQQQDAKNEPKIELTLEAMQEIYKEQEQFQDAVLDYELPQILDDVSNPLTFKEKKKLKKFNLKELDNMDDNEFDSLLEEFLSLRDIRDDDMDSLEYSDLQMWVRRVVLTTFNIRIVAKKK